MAGLWSKKYSSLIWVIQISLDIFIFYFLAFKLLNLGDDRIYFFSFDFLNNKYFLFFIYATTSWITLSYLLNFYQSTRHSSWITIFTTLVKQFLFFSISIYAFIGVFRSININAIITLRYLAITFLIIALINTVKFYLFNRLGFDLQGGIKQIIIVGYNESSAELKSLVSSRKELGYKLKGVFSNKKNDITSGNIEDAISFMGKDHHIDEIYCTIDELSEDEVNEFVKLASLNQIGLKFISSAENYHTKRFETHYYDYLPVLSIKEAALNNGVNQFIKRTFDILFSIIIIVLILSWLIPLFGLLIKMESKGAVFFKHKRNGINYKEFTCYKFRSLRKTNLSPLNQVSEDDSRVTRIGRFIRRTSIDELPQFFNVLLGNMSVVGPRPHMLPFTSEYSKKIDKYRFAFRHSVKPGITGLAQVKGCRGEIKNDEDIINRVKYDIFYIENWFILLDIKIIAQTFLNIIKGEENAY